MSLLATTSATERATDGALLAQVAPAAPARGRTRSRAAPLFFTRLRQIGSPITPRPMKPMHWYGAIAYFTNERDGGRCRAKASTLSLARG